MRRFVEHRLEHLSRQQFARAWSAVLYLFPNLHPDGYEHSDSGWLRILKRFASEAWRRAKTGEPTDKESYACDAQWSGLFDRMLVHLPEDTEHRV